MTMSDSPRILYCHCAYANVVPKDVKEAVLLRLTESGTAFDAVPDLCEMSAQKDPALNDLMCGGDVRIAACYPRAVKWLFAGAGITLDESRVTVHNMRQESADEVVGALLGVARAPDGTAAP